MNQPPEPVRLRPKMEKKKRVEAQREHAGKAVHIYYEADGSDSVKDRIDPIKSSSESGSFAEPA
ncbi:MAG: hypothetical protein P8016_15960 [Sedimentisphaerales bacterium]